MVILASVAITLCLENSGIFNKAKYARDEYLNAKDYEETKISEISNSVDKYIGSERLTTDDIEQIRNMLYPNKTLNITSSFTDVTTNQTYTINRDGWLYITTARNQEYNTISFYRNDMQILTYNGIKTTTSSSVVGNENVYIPVKQGDIIKKVQNGTGFNTKVFLYYYEQ